MTAAALRTRLLSVARDALAEVEGAACVQRSLSRHSPPENPVYIIALGKAAVSMTEGAFAVLGKRIAEAVVVTKYGHSGGFNPAWPAELIEAGHPVPDENSLEAGRRVRAALQRWPVQGCILALISGGGSALVECLRPGVDLEILRRVNQWLLGAGLDIQAMNAVRARLSLIKGGGLSALSGDRSVLQLLISDVPGDDPAVIASGPWVAAPATLPDLDWPAWLQPLLSKHASPRVQAAAAVETRIVASNADARRAAELSAANEGWRCRHNGAFDGEIEQVTENIAKQLIAGEPGFYVWGGESHILLPPDAGHGGRNQHMALLLARRLEGRSCTVLCLATDGSDGPGEDAGGWADGETVQRGRLAGVNAEACLQRFDAGAFMEATGDLVNTGPTGTNVMDLVMAVKK